MGARHPKSVAPSVSLDVLFGRRTLDPLLLWLTPVEWLSLSYTCHAAHRTCTWRVAARLRLALNELLATVFPEFQSMLPTLLRPNEAVLRGSALVWVWFMDAHWRPEDLDVFVARDAFPAFCQRARRSGLLWDGNLNEGYYITTRSKMDCPDMLVTFGCALEPFRAAEDDDDEWPPWPILCAPDASQPLFLDLEREFGWPDVRCWVKGKHIHCPVQTTVDTTPGLDMCDSRFDGQTWTGGFRHGVEALLQRQFFCAWINDDALHPLTSQSFRHLCKYHERQFQCLPDPTHAERRRRELRR